MARITQVGVFLSKKKGQPRAFRVTTDFPLDSQKTWKVILTDPGGNHTWVGFIIPDDGNQPTAATIYAVRTKGPTLQGNGLGSEETGQITVVISDVPNTTMSDALLLPVVLEP